MMASLARSSKQPTSHCYICESLIGRSLVIFGGAAGQILLQLK